MLTVNRILKSCEIIRILNLFAAHSCLVPHRGHSMFVLCENGKIVPDKNGSLFVLVVVSV